MFQQLDDLADVELEDFREPLAGAVDDGAELAAVEGSCLISKSIWNLDKLLSENIPQKAKLLS